MSAAVKNIAFDSSRVTYFEPARVDHRTTDSGLKELGSVFMTFEAAGRTEPWTLRYEEVIYVVSGEVTLTVIDGDTDSTVAGAEGDVLTLYKGSTVRYGAIAGTRLFVSIVPVKWRELEAGGNPVSSS